MTSIVRPAIKDVQLLSDLSRVSFIESHGSSAAPEVINKYIDEKFNPDVLKEELGNPQNIYHVIYYENEPAGFSKIILNSQHAGIEAKNVTKLERLYLLKEFYGLRLGFDLLQFNIGISRDNNQTGMWLYVWKENARAINFYKKNGFDSIGSYDFMLTASHSNPNYHMFLEY